MDSAGMLGGLAGKGHEGDCCSNGSILYQVGKLHIVGQARSGAPPVFVNKVVLEHSHAYSFTFLPTAVFIHAIGKLSCNFHTGLLLLCCKRKDSIAHKA